MFLNISIFMDGELFILFEYVWFRQYRRVLPAVWEILEIDGVIGAEVIGPFWVDAFEK